jgi:hypothetical protein
VAKHSRSELILINFVLDSMHPLLAHQADVVSALAPKFNRVTVITGKVGKFEQPSNVDVIDLDWVEGKSFRNVYRLFKSFLSVLRPKESVVFSHMTDVQAAVLSPITRITRTPHYLWYAHKQLSPFLRFASFFIDGVFTSTSGSCPLSGRKVLVIGQGVDSSLFKAETKVTGALDSCIHIGRADPSKNLRELFEFTADERSKNPKFKFTQVGSPSTAEARLNLEMLSKEFLDSILSGAIRLLPSTTRVHVPNLLANTDFFIHAYKGSLDKSLIESTLARVPVLTLNEEYCRIFGTWSDEKMPSLHHEYKALKNRSGESLQAEIERRFKLADESHSFVGWIDKILKILQTS